MATGPYPRAAAGLILSHSRVSRDDVRVSAADAAHVPRRGPDLLAKRYVLELRGTLVLGIRGARGR